MPKAGWSRPIPLCSPPPACRRPPRRRARRAQIATWRGSPGASGITVARPAIAADGERDLDLWVRAEPRGRRRRARDQRLDRPRRARCAPKRPQAEREADFLRAAADWTFETDETLALTQISPAGAAALGRAAGELIGRRLVHLLRFREGADGALPILLALAEHARFEGSLPRRARSGAIPCPACPD
jgi:PAS domain-containing protein